MLPSSVTEFDEVCAHSTKPLIYIYTYMACKAHLSSCFQVILHTILGKTLSLQEQAIFRYCDYYATIMQRKILLLRNKWNLWWIQSNVRSQPNFLCSITITAYKYFYSACIRYSIPVENVVCVLAGAGDKEDGWIMQIYINAMSNKKVFLMMTMLSCSIHNVSS